MANTEAAAGTPAEPTNAPQAGSSAPSGQPENEPKPQAGEDTFSLEEAKKLRSEAASLRRRLKEFEDAKKAADEASLSEVDRLKKRVKDLEESERTAQAEARTFRIRSAVEREAHKRRFADPADAYSLISHTAIELGEDGEPTNVGELLNTLAESKPYLLTAESAQAAAQPARPQRPLPSTPRAAAPPAPADLVAQAEQDLRKTGRYSRLA